MVIGLIGAGNMGSALARGLAEPLLVVDAEPSRARALADELGGEALASAAAVAERADVVILAHKPGQLDGVAGELGQPPRAVASILGGTPLSAIERAYPGVPAYRFMPNLAVEARQGVLCYAPGERAADGPERELLELIGRTGTVIELDEPLIEPATALMGCGPAFFALVVEALVDAGVRHGLTSDSAGADGLADHGRHRGAARRRELAPAELRRRVTSPGGSTARGVAELERGGVRAAFAEAVAAVVEAGRR